MLPVVVAAREARDRARFEEEALTHADQLYRIALRLTGSPTAAEDLVQEAYLRAFRSWRSFTPGTNLAAWLATILRNVNLDAVRKQSRRPQQESIDEQGDYYLYNRLSEAAGAATGRGARPAWRCGRDRRIRWRICLRHSARWWCWWTSVSFRTPTLRGSWAYPIGTVMSRLYRGRRLLKQALADRAPAQEPTA